MGREMNLNINLKLIYQKLGEQNVHQRKQARCPNHQWQKGDIFLYEAVEDRLINQTQPLFLLTGLLGLLDR